MHMWNLKYSFGSLVQLELRESNVYNTTLQLKGWQL